MLESHPVQLGILFGSQARGTSDSHSDVAVAFDATLSEEGERRRAAFETRTTEQTHKQRMQRFDELLAEMEDKA